MFYKNNKYPLIHHLSYPEFISMNQYTEPTTRFVHYQLTMQQRWYLIIKVWHKVYHSIYADFQLLGFKVNLNCYFDKTMQSGISISCVSWKKCFSTSQDHSERVKQSAYALYNHWLLRWVRYWILSSLLRFSRPRTCYEYCKICVIYALLLLNLKPSIMHCFTMGPERGRPDARL